MDGYKGGVNYAIDIQRGEQERPPQNRRSEEGAEEIADAGSGWGQKPCFYTSSSSVGHLPGKEEESAGKSQRLRPLLIIGLSQSGKKQ